MRPTNRFLRDVSLTVFAASAALFFSLFSASRTNADDAPQRSRPLRIVYFTPSDVEPLPDRAERLFRVMSQVQTFYRDEMERNGFGPTTFELELEKPGVLKLYDVRAPKPQCEYGRDAHAAVRQVVADALAQEGIDANREIVVIFQRGLRWKDGKATEVGPFVGGGSPFSGTAWVYDDPLLNADLLSSKEPGGFYFRPCSIGQFNTHYIGGIAHELGHALTLPHDCELDADSARGRALMGAGNHTFGEEERGEGAGAFLTFSEALRLSVVPAISGREPRQLPIDVRLATLSATRISDSKLRLNGVVETKSPIRGLIVYLDRDSRDSDYDAKTWTAFPDVNGAFEIELTEVAAEPSELRICVVRDVDALTLDRFALKLDGNADEFAPITRRFQSAKIRAAFAAQDSAALLALGRDEFQNDETFQNFCQELAATVDAMKNPVAPAVPADVDKSLRKFDLSRSQFDEETVGWARLERDRSLDGAFLQVDEIGFATGLFAHSPSRLECRLGKNWKSLKFGFGLQDDSRGSVVFVVRGDGRELFRSGVVRRGKLDFAELSVDGIDVLELSTEDAGDGNAADWAVWLKPTLSR